MLLFSNNFSEKLLPNCKYNSFLMFVSKWRTLTSNKKDFWLNQYFWLYILYYYLSKTSWFLVETKSIRIFFLIIFHLVLAYISGNLSIRNGNNNLNQFGSFRKKKTYILVLKSTKKDQLYKIYLLSEWN